ncbi:MAG: S-methyl-5-thioribose-1-phosphate isomerase [Pseudomonadota bacterium]
MSFRTLEWRDEDGTLILIDQRKLPDSVEYLELHDEVEIARAIRDMVVRGAPAIGVSAAYGILSAIRRFDGAGLEAARAHLDSADDILRASRPTAVNLFWALDRMKRVAASAASVEELRDKLKTEAERIEEEDRQISIGISQHAMNVVPQKATFFHHCNTGTLAAVDLGTALGVIRTAHESGREVMAYVDETRPRLQGAKLTSWELQQYGVPHAIVVDGASAHIMRTHKVDLAIVGCDRVAANGDVANKIGTYNLALAAKDNDVPFYVAAPSSTVDLATPSGDDIEIEARDPAEVTEINGVSIAPENAPAFNPAFDVTPARLIAGIITEHGIARPPYEASLKALLSQGGAHK